MLRTSLLAIWFAIVFVDFAAAQNSKMRVPQAFEKFSLPIVIEYLQKYGDALKSSAIVEACGQQKLADSIRRMVPPRPKEFLEHDALLTTFAQRNGLDLTVDQRVWMHNMTTYMGLMLAQGYRIGFRDAMLEAFKFESYRAKFCKK